MYELCYGYGKPEDEEKAGLLYGCRQFHCSLKNR